MKQVVLPIGLAVGLAVLAGCGHSTLANGVAKAEPVVQAPVTVVARTAVAAPYEAVGTVRSKLSSTIQSKATGHVTAVYVKEGDHVKKGQVLAEIDQREAQAQLQQAESGLREAQDARTEVERAIQAAIHAQSAAEAGAAMAHTTYERYKGLVDQGALSQQAFDEANAKRKATAAEVAQAGEMVASTEAKRSEADARIHQAEAQVASARTFLTYTTVKAPFDGIVTRKTVDVGDLAAPGVPLFQIESARQYRLEALVDDSLLGTIKLGEKVPVIVGSASSKRLLGTVAEVVPSADPSSRTFVVKVDLPSDPAVRSGIFGRAEFPRGDQETLTVPASAVMQHGELTSVFVVGHDHVARMRLITAGRTHDGRTQVLSGLNAGERIVASRVDRVSDGSVIAQG